MSIEESLKRKSPEKEVQNIEEALNAPETKVQKIDTETVESNLKNSDCNEEEKCTFEITEVNSVANECTEEKTTDTENLEQSQTPPCNISIKFHDEKMVNDYKTKFIEFLHSFVEFQVIEDDSSIAVYKDDSIQPRSDLIVTDTTKENSNISVIETTTVMTTVETHQSLADIIIVDDSTPSPSKKKRKRHSKVKKELFIVDATPSPNGAQADLRYTTKFTISSEKVDEKGNSENTARQGCFNCDQLHSLKDCPLPRDYNRINQARQKLFRQQSKSSRYHTEEEQKYSHLAPGKFSFELKKALGLRLNEAPHFIYLMRKFGYPPGWLEEAKFVHSDLEMFDIHGNYVKTASVKKRGLDPAKVVDFPGFNVPFEKGIRDEYRKHCVPPYSENFSKEAMINFFDKKLAQEEDNLETCDMDIDHEHDANSQEKEPGIQVEDGNGRQNRESPSLLDLEQQKQQLLEELQDETKIDKSDKEFLSVKTTHFGTPLIKSNSPYITLPDPDKFSKDVSPVINFENLPNSTGKYEQMTDVLQKVRTTLKRMHSCNT